MVSKTTMMRSSDMTSVEGSTWAPLWVGFSGEDTCNKTDLKTCTAAYLMDFYILRALSQNSYIYKFLKGRNVIFYFLVS